MYKPTQTSTITQIKYKRMQKLSLIIYIIDYNNIERYKKIYLIAFLAFSIFLFTLGILLDGFKIFIPL